MRFLLSWSIKFSIMALIYAGLTTGFSVKLPAQVLGYKVPAQAQQWLDANAQIDNLGQQTTAGFKQLGDVLQ